MGYFKLGLTSFSTITRELRVVEFFGLYIRDLEEILDRFDVSYVVMGRTSESESEKSDLKSQIRIRIRIREFQR